MSEELVTKVELELVEDMLFRCDMGNIKVKECYIDERDPNEYEMLGPNPSKLLASAVLGCISASFLYCLQKKNLKLNELTGEAVVIVARNEKGLLRVREINVELITKTSDPKVIKRIEQCKKMFEQYCTITESVRAGIKVNLKVER